MRDFAGESVIAGWGMADGEDFEKKCLKSKLTVFFLTVVLSVPTDTSRPPGFVGLFWTGMFSPSLLLPKNWENPLAGNCGYRYLHIVKNPSRGKSYG